MIYRENVRLYVMNKLKKLLDKTVTDSFEMDLKIHPMKRPPNPNNSFCMYLIAYWLNIHNALCMFACKFLFLFFLNTSM